MLQSGRLHTHSFWDFLRAGDESRAPAADRERLLLDIAWWIRVLEDWEQGRGLGQEYRILSASALRNDPRSIYVNQSDASGEDGVGYLHGSLADTDLQYGSHAWGPEGPPGSTHAMELRALRLCMAEDTISVRNCLLIWVTDPTSAALSVNKGTCSSPEGRQELEAILKACDGRGLEIVALWVPREDDIVADYLFYLAAILDRKEAKGWMSSLANAAG